jgi:hypothetical protein
MRRAIASVSPARFCRPYLRRSPKVAEVPPILYLCGLATGDFRPALEGLLGADAAELSPTHIARLTASWKQECGEFQLRRQSGYAHPPPFARLDSFRWCQHCDG